MLNATENWCWFLYRINFFSNCLNWIALVYRFSLQWVRKSGCKLSSLFWKTSFCLWIQIGIIPAFWKNTVFLYMPCLRPGSSVFCRSCDCTGPTIQSHWSTDCNPLIFELHFFRAYFIYLEIAQRQLWLPFPPSVWEPLAPPASYTYAWERKEWKVMHPLARKGEDSESCPCAEDLFCKTGQVD